MGFISDKFLLQSESARRLYQDYAVDQPIYDYHCHLPVKEIAENRRFANLFEIWLEGDHYKWRAMRADGASEHYCTGNADPYEKFLAWARTVPNTLRNPLYHWTHLELQRYFGIDELLDERSAPRIWKEANRQLAGEDLTAHGILKKFDVRVVCTTDDPTDSLQYHQQIQASGLPTRVFPAFRPDKALKTEDPVAFNQWTSALSACANMEISGLADFLYALEKRHDFFHEQGCRLSDHGLDYCFAECCTDAEAEGIFTKVRGGKEVTSAESAKFASFMMLFFGRLDAKKGWTKQLHLGAARSLNTRMLKAAGRDTGFDAIGDWRQAAPLAKYLDRLDQDKLLPKIIVYNLNPPDDYVFATMMGNFPEEGVPGKLQFGSGWWFLDQKEAIEWQLNALSNCGLLSKFVGMTTDSRSFMSYPRHEYFRRVLCNLVGGEMETGLLPDDFPLVGKMIRNICYANADAYFGLLGVQADAEPAVVAGHRK
jgi:glucuronate isomerase